MSTTCMLFNTIICLLLVCYYLGSRFFGLNEYLVTMNPNVYDFKMFLFHVCHKVFFFNFSISKFWIKFPQKRKKIKIELTIEKQTKSFFFGKPTNMSQKNTYTSRFYLKLNLCLARQKISPTFKCYSSLN